MELRTLDDCEQALLAYIPPPRSQRENYTLERMHALMAALGNPQERYQVIHMAGTSGKTSTCYYAAGLLTQVGLKTGLTVSPHITRVNERVQIDMQPANEELFARELTTFLHIVDDTHLKPTYFEVLMAFAYWFFARQHVDVAVIETGVGGLLDGSNVVQNPDKVCVLTDIGLDHTALLGETIPEIAAQKAGIIHPHNQVFFHRQAPDVMQVFQAAAHQNYANAHVLEENIRAAADVLPAFQKRNFSLAATAVQFVLGRCGMTPLSDEQMQKGSLLHIPARMEQFKVHGRLVTLDGAHNPQKMAALVSGYKVQQDEAPVVLYSCIEGPDAKIDQTLDELLKLRPQKIILTAFQSMQDLKKLSVEPQLLQAVLARKGYAHTEVIREAHEALRQALSLSAPLVIAGSLYLVFEVRNDLIRLADGQA